VKLGPARVPCFLEFDVEASAPEREPDQRYATVQLSMPGTGRIVTEDGTELVKFDLSGD
jgi:hypothetical protein